MLTTHSLNEWTLARLEDAKECDCVIVRDPLRLLPEGGGIIHNFGREYNFSVITASTNLVFRELYHQSREDQSIKKLLFIDRSPLSRKAKRTTMKSLPILYPDILSRTAGKAVINLDLQQYLKEITHDPAWPEETNETFHARLIVKNLDAVLRAHRNLRTAHPERFTDSDLRTIVAYAALGIPDYAFKKLDAEGYWKMSLLEYEALESIESLSPDITARIRDELKKAPPPFSWFAHHNPETATTTFYLSVILAQHCEDWHLLLANLDPNLIQPEKMADRELFACAEALIKIDSPQAHYAIESVEDKLTSRNLSLILIDRLKINAKGGYVAPLEKERYSTLIRSLCLLLALENILSTSVNKGAHEKIGTILFEDGKASKPSFVDSRKSPCWSNLKEAYRLVKIFIPLYQELFNQLKTLKMKNTADLTFSYFRSLWNDNKINRMEYYISKLERLISSGSFLPKSEEELPSIFSNAIVKIRERIKTLDDELQKFLKELNLHFQKYVAAHYTEWIDKDGEVCLTSQFLKRALRPHWDPEKEKALVLIFDGMRYDIWDELMRPVLEERLEVIADLPGLSLLPSETHITRKAISAGTFPDQFSTSDGEDKLLASALERVFGYKGGVKVMEQVGTGEVVRYRAGNLDMIIFELCDNELHKIGVKIKDGREIPSRPMSFIYDQHIRNIINTEVMSIVRGLAPGTKIFIVADHGFTRVARERLTCESGWLNDISDCSFQYARLLKNVSSLHTSDKFKNGIWEFAPNALRMPEKETVFDKKLKCTKDKYYQSVIFPKTGNALSRPGSHFNPDAYSHGGISLQELIIPMIVLKVKEKEKGLLAMSGIKAADECGESEDLLFSIRLTPTKDKAQESMRVDMEAVLGSTGTGGEREISRQICFVPPGGYEFSASVKLNFDDATDEERKNGVMERVLTVSVSWREGHHVVRRSCSHKFTVRLNNERVIRRVPASLGNILGLMPRK